MEKYVQATMSCKRRVKKDTLRKQGAYGGNQYPDIIPPVISSCIHHSAYTKQRLQDPLHTHRHLTFILKLLKIIVKIKVFWYILLQESYNKLIQFITTYKWYYTSSQKPFIAHS